MVDVVTVVNKTNKDKQMSKKFTANLKVGDMVVVSNLNFRSVLVVERVTKTQLILSNGARFNRNTGRRVGDYDLFNYTVLEEATEERVAEVQRNNKTARLARKLRSQQWGKMTLEELIKVNEALPQGKEDE